jgi:hypothetical protein
VFKAKKSRLLRFGKFEIRSEKGSSSSTSPSSPSSSSSSAAAAAGVESGVLGLDLGAANPVL